MTTDFKGARGLRSVRMRWFNALGAEAADIGEVLDPEPTSFRLCSRPLRRWVGRDGVSGYQRLHSRVRPRPRVRAGALVPTPPRRDRRDHLGNGHGASVQQVIDMVQSVTGRSMRDASGHRKRFGATKAGHILPCERLRIDDDTLSS